MDDTLVPSGCFILEKMKPCETKIMDMTINVELGSLVDNSDKEIV